MLSKIDVSSIQLGSRFSEAVFFDDGVCMFLGKEKPVKPLHIAVIKRWKIPFLMTAGKLCSPEFDDSVADLEELVEVEELEEI